MYQISDSAYNLLKNNVLRILDTATKYVSLQKDYASSSSYNIGVDAVLNPHEFFHLQFRNVYIYVRRYGSTSEYHYCVVVERHEFPYCARNPYINNGYGDFDHLNDALVLFREFCQKLFTAYVGKEYEFTQLELY